MSLVMKGFCISGLGAGIVLCCSDWLTSISGFQMILGEGNGGMVAAFLPLAFATLALSFNAMSSFFFAMFVQTRRELAQPTGERPDFTTVVTTILWFAFVFFDCISSLGGILSIYTGVMVTSWAGFQEATRTLGGFGALFALLVAALLSLSPFIVALFGEALKKDQ